MPALPALGRAEEGYAFVPSGDLLERSNVARFMKAHEISDWRELVRRAGEDISWYWDAVNADLGIEWFEKYDRVYDSSRGIQHTKWFVNGKCNVVANAIDMHARAHPERLAYIFAGESGPKQITYGELDRRVSRLASGLADLGIGRGDVVAIYMPMTEEAICSIFACSKIGAVHTTVFSGFGPAALRSRLVDSKAKVLITADAMKRRGKLIGLKANWTKAVEGTGTRVITTGDGGMRYSELALSGGTARTEIMDSEDPLFILYTSGTTGQPKGTVQVHGGFTLVAAQQAAYLTDIRPDDVLFWYADIGWITGQVWPVYGSAILGATSVIYEDSLDYPRPDSWCQLVQDHRATVFGAAPTAIRLSMKHNVVPAKYDMASLRILATTGEPINAEAWRWFFDKVGGRRCPVVNVSGGTEIGGAIVGVLPVMPLKECTVGCPVPGFDAAAFDEQGNSVPEGEGLLVIRKPWPSMTRGLLNNPQRFYESYWSKFGKVWYHGDVVYIDSQGMWYMRGRADDVIKVAGHRIGTTEIEEAAASHLAVAEALAVGVPDAIKGESIIVLAVLKQAGAPKGVESEIAGRVQEMIGKFARPDRVRIVAELPKTRTGKLLRRIVRAKLSGLGLESQDLSSVENPWCLDGI